MGLAFLVSSAGDAVGSSDFVCSCGSASGLCFASINDFRYETFFEKHGYRLFFCFFEDFFLFV